ncbi:MAG TPA: GDSL-type esterase/lipase family protein [Thermoanaerobaculia bacterium]|nr:GDSL-type esterase/lipase family protein [Thermoanaerobaculia bacterium]
MNKRLLGAAVLGTSLLVALAAAEVGLRLISKYWLTVYDVEMWRYARQIKTLSSYPGVVEEQRPNASAFLMGAKVRTEEHGFRLPDPETQARRRPGNRLAVALGDSLTFGWGVPEGQTFPDQLERLLSARCPAAAGRAVTVANAGIGNCNTSMEVQRYKLRIRPYMHPDWVILGFSFNDAEPDAVPDTNPLYWHSALLSLAAARMQKQTDPKLANYNAYYVGLFREGKAGWDRTKAAMRELGALLRADHVAATLFLMPELHDPHDSGIAEAFSRVAAVGREAGFEVIDPAPDFPPGSGERYWVSHEDAHPNAAAQAIYARALARSRYACLP